MPPTSLSRFGKSGKRIHGARNVRSSRATWHCRASARAQPFSPLSELLGYASRLPTTFAVEAANRSRHLRVAARVVGREADAVARSL